ncbi:hypothetical protein [Ramlibacter humi]|uniref:Uncharacterized protein n=1 Tax=Ramlibacter humi TaxID=2530451 RepID=A0A4Z0BGP1_9BURK|nr:hypothetical protein [Ramlibacter humi]TFY97078.1 hypothetical protein EZ216_19660 [Ramlibacter humi]
MTLIPRQLPMDAAAAPAAPGTPSGVDKAWQLAMEKAQTRQWFHGAVGHGHAAIAGGPSAPQANRDVAMPRGGQVMANGDMPVPGPATSRADGRVAAAVRTTPATALALAKTSSVHRALVLSAATQPAGSPQPVKQRAVAVDGAPASDTASPSAQPAPAPSPDMRVHVEESAGGLRVWVGIAGDAAAVAARAQVLLADLRRQCAETGHRLQKVVCNGEVFFEAPVGGSPAALSSFHSPQEP